MRRAPVHPAEVRLLSGTAVLFLGNLVSAGLGFALLLVLARSLGPRQFGVLAPIVNVLDIGQMFIDALVTAGAVQVAARYLERDPPRANMAFKLAFYLRLLVAAAAAMVGWACAPWLSRLLFDDASWADTLRVTFLGLLGVAVYLSATATLQATQRFSWLALVACYKNLIRLAAIGAVLFAGVLSVHWAVWAYVVATVLYAAAGALTVPFGYLRVPGFSRAIAAEMYSTNKWMVVVMLGFVVSRADLYMLVGMANEHQAGLYAAAFQLCVAVTLFSQALFTAIFPSVSAYTTKEQMDRHLRRSERLAPLALLPLALGVALAGWVIDLLFGAQYAEATSVFQLLLGSAFLTLATNPILMLLFPLGRVSVMAACTLTQSLGRVVLNLFLIPLYGAKGAALAEITVKALTIGPAIAAVHWFLKRPSAAPAQGSESPPMRET